MTATSNLTLFPSQAPGLRWYQRLRLRYCTISTECRWRWFFLVFGILYVVVVTHCLGLVLRLLLHSILLMCSFFVVAYGYAWYTVHQRLTKLDNEVETSGGVTDHYTWRRAKVVRTKTIPKEPHPQLPQKVLCWVELMEESHCYHTSNRPEWIGRTGKTAAPEKDGMEDQEEETNDDDDDDKDWNHVPCVIAQELNDKSTEEKIQKGDHLVVHLLDFDPMRLIYVPFQRIALGRMRKSVINCMLWAVGAWVALSLIFRDIPVVGASSDELEDVFNSFSDSFWAGFEDWLDKVLPDDDDEDDMDTDDRPACRIPWFVSVSYDAILLMQIAMPLGVYLYVRWKTRRSLFEEAPTDSYHLLRGDEDEDELAASVGPVASSTSSSTPATSAVVI